MLLIISILVLSFVLYVGGMILYAIITQFNPPPVEDVTVVKPKTGTAPSTLNDSTFTFLIWNLGYGGLGKEVDYFLDGGKMVTSPKQHVFKNNAGITNFLSQNKDVDFILLQEVDRKGKRSWNIDQAEEFASVLPNYNYSYTVNFDIKFLSYPYFNPIGRVYGGLQTLSKYTPIETKRIALPNITDIPRKWFYLKRCVLMQRYKLANGKDLVVINPHFEAYDKGGTVKKQQREVVKKILLDEYGKGNYVVLGGDWNIAPPGFNVHQWEHTKKIEDPGYLANNDSIYIPGWNYAFDPTTATNRANDMTYVEGQTYKTIIDYFYVSPNIQVDKINAIDLGFNYSDHNPVKMKVTLK